MHKFFRKIRQNLLMENKTGKYFKYGLGEIVLVFIGILVALQINNWNEDRQVDDIGENYYGQLLLDLKADKTYCKSIISSLESYSVGHNNYIKIYSEPDLDISKVNTEIQNIPFGTLEIEFKTSTIKTFTSTGDINLIPTFLGSKMTVYNGSQLSSKMLANGNNASSENMLQNALMNGANSDLLIRLQNQPKLNKSLGIENNFPKIVSEGEAFMFWKQFGENGTMRSFKSLIN